MSENKVGEGKTGKQHGNNKNKRVRVEPREYLKYPKYPKVYKDIKK